VTAHLALEHVSKHFGGVVANDHISLEVRKEEIVGLIGPNGSGKTTLFNSIVGHHRIDSGRIYFEGRDITGLGVSRVARLGVLRTFQQTRSYRDMTCLENLAVSLPHPDLRLLQLPRRLPAGTTSRALGALELVGLADQRYKLAGELSFGQQRLLEIAMGLMNNPKILLLDEPTAGINPSLITAIVAQLRRVRHELGISLLVIEHNISVIIDLAERIYCLNHGRILAEGPPSRIREDPTVIEAYLGFRR
jgi:branched-chain amino acid transport system ATP-binding protein